MILVLITSYGSSILPQLHLEEETTVCHVKLSTLFDDKAIAIGCMLATLLPVGMIRIIGYSCFVYLIQVSCLFAACYYL